MEAYYNFFDYLSPLGVVWTTLILATLIGSIFFSFLLSIVMEKKISHIILLFLSCFAPLLLGLIRTFLNSIEYDRTLQEKPDLPQYVITAIEKNIHFPTEVGGIFSIIPISICLIVLTIRFIKKK